jgi:hypothetical protein
MKLPKSKYYIKNIIETIQLDPYTTIEIDAFYDTTHKGNRYSCTVTHQLGTAICGGYGTNNEITLKTYESALLYALELANADKQTIRNFRLKLLLS